MNTPGTLEIVLLDAQEEHVDNERKLAAFDDLLAFAHAFLKSWTGPGPTDSPLEAQCRAAIAKAEPQ